jgi:hypothetical protein
LAYSSKLNYCEIGKIYYVKSGIVPIITAFPGNLFDLLHRATVAPVSNFGNCFCIMIQKEVPELGFKIMSAMRRIQRELRDMQFSTTYNCGAGPLTGEDLLNWCGFIIGPV